MAKKQQRRGRPHVDEITDVQRNALKEVRDYIAARKYPPTMNELGERLFSDKEPSQQQHPEACQST